MNIMEAKLSPFNKILLATSGINYLASAIESLDDSQNERKEFLLKILADVTKAMEECMDFLNGCDAVLPVDERIMKVTSEILIFGMDDVELEYNLTA